MAKRNKGVRDFGSGKRLDSIQNVIGLEMVSIVEDDARTITMVGARDTSGLPLAVRDQTIQPIPLVFYNFGNAKVTDAIFYKKEYCMIVINH